MRPQRTRHVSALPQVQPVEGFVGEQDRLRRQQADREERALPLAFGQRADRRVHQRREIELVYDSVDT